MLYYNICIYSKYRLWAILFYCIDNKYDII